MKNGARNAQRQKNTLIEKAVVEVYVVHVLASSSVNSLVKSLNSLEILKVCHAAPMRSHWPSKSSQ